MPSHINNLTKRNTCDEDDDDDDEHAMYNAENQPIEWCGHVLLSENTW